MKLNNIQKFSKGEIVLIILLIMAVGLTLGLSIASRSLTDLKQSNQIEESTRAFSAAEAGIEKAIESGVYNMSSIPQTSIGNAKYTVDVTPYGNTSSLYVFDSIIQNSDSETLWLARHNSDGSINLSEGFYNANNIQVCWRSLSGTPALEISVFYGNPSGTYKTARTAFDPDTSRSTINNFIVPKNEGGYCSTANGGSYTYYAIIDFNSMGLTLPSNDIPIALRVRPVYSDAEIAILPLNGASIPEQGKNILSTGQTNSGVTRKWNVTNGFPASKDIFDYAVWSGDSLTKSAIP